MRGLQQHVFLAILACAAGCAAQGAPSAAAADAAGDLAAADVPDVLDDAPAASDAALLDADAFGDAELDALLDAAPLDVPDSADAADSSDAPDAADLPAAPTSWTSALLPPDWTPAFTAPDGRFLHDVSYSGYHLGGADPADPVAAAVFDVVDYGANPTETFDNTASFQKTIDAAAKAGGGIVHVGAGLYRLDGALSVQHSGIVLRGDGPTASRLYFTQFKGLNYGAHITFGALPKDGVDLPLAVTGTNRSADVRVPNAAALQVGDAVAVGWVITPEFIADHGMTGTWQAFNGTWQPFFRRRVLAIDTGVTPHKVTLDVPLRYEALPRDKASLRVETGWLTEVGVEHLGLSDAVAYTDAWTSTQQHLLAMRGVAEGWVRDVDTFAAPLSPKDGNGTGAHVQSGGLLLEASMRVTVANCHFGKAENRGDGGNGYLFEVRTSSEVLMRDCEGLNGRHNFIQNWGFGMSGWVLLRCHSAGGLNQIVQDYELGLMAHSEFHHSLAMANLIDDCTFDDGFNAVNRELESTGAGQTATQTVFWRTHGTGQIRSLQYGWGYVIGSDPQTQVVTAMTDLGSAGTLPVDWSEGLGNAATLEPKSLYAQQHLLRVGW